MTYNLIHQWESMRLLIQFPKCLRSISTANIFKSSIRTGIMPASRTNSESLARFLNRPLNVADPELFQLIGEEKYRQKHSLEMIASENFTTVPVLQCLATCLHNKYSEGIPGQRYYGGTEIIDKVEILAQKRALQAFKLDANEWGVNVQPYSGSPANFAVYTALLGAGGRFMGLDLPDGGHLTHGYATPAGKKISATAQFFETMPYKVNPATGLIDYDQLEVTARLFRPQLIVAGISCYSRCLDYQRMRNICNEVRAVLFADMSHVAGLVAANLIPSPFQHCDVVMTTTHKSLRGPRAAMIFFKRTGGGDFEGRINQAVFPGLQGGPHNNAIAGIATAMLQVQSEEFNVYQRQVLANAKRLCAGLQQCGYKIATDGTDVHLVLVDLRGRNGVSGAKAEYLLEQVAIACNKNTVPGDKSALNPSGIRLGTPALTTRGFVESDMDRVVDFIDKGIKLVELVATKGKNPTATMKLAEFKEFLNNDPDMKKQMADLRRQVEAFSGQFVLPGYEDY